MSDENQKKPDTLAVCKSCGETKVRNPAGKFPNGRDTKYVDAEGKQWNGKKCSSCVATHMKTHQKVKRSKKNLQ